MFILTRRIIFVIIFICLVSLSLFLIWSEANSLDRLDTFLNYAAQFAAIGGLLGLLYQFKRERDLNEAQFIVQLNQEFITNRTISRIYQLLEESKINKQEQNPFDEADIIDMANYLSFFDPFYGLLNRKVINIETLDILAYRFFLATNNRYFQEILLCKSGKEIAWMGIYKLHNIWRTHRLKNNLSIWQEDFDLSKCDVYNKINALLS